MFKSIDKGIDSSHFFSFLLFLDLTPMKFNFVCKWKLIFQKLFDFAMSINNSGCCVEKVLVPNHNAFYSPHSSTYKHTLDCSQTSLNHQSMTEWCNKFTCMHITPAFVPWSKSYGKIWEVIEMSLFLARFLIAWPEGRLL